MIDKSIRLSKLKISFKEVCKLDIYLSKYLPVDLKQIEDIVDTVVSMNPFCKKRHVILILSTYLSLLRDKLLLDQNPPMIGKFWGFHIDYLPEKRKFVLTFNYTRSRTVNDYL